MENDTLAVPVLTSEEENILRYAAGYVPLKLLQQYEKSLDLEETTSGTRRSVEHWTDVLKALEFFKVVQMQVRKKLLIAFDTNIVDQESLRETIINSIVSNSDVQFFWTLLSVDIETEAHATKVLKQIISIWLTIRGNSIAETWLDKYLRNKAAKKKGLHTELKRTTQTPESITN